MSVRFQLSSNLQHKKGKHRMSGVIIDSAHVIGQFNFLDSLVTDLGRDDDSWTSGIALREIRVKTCSFKLYSMHYL